MAVKEVVCRAIPSGAVGIPGSRESLKTGREPLASHQPVGGVVAIQGLDGKLTSLPVLMETKARTRVRALHTAQRDHRVCLLGLF